jgi:hypothetical protein
MPKITNAKIDNYTTILTEKSRPPSKGGNTKARHSHAIFIDNVKYTFLAFGSQQWVFKADTVSFEYDVVDNKYNNIKNETLVTVDKSGIEVVRGNRATKKLRTADTRLPARRSEWKD